MVPGIPKWRLKVLLDLQLGKRHLPTIQLPETAFTTRQLIEQNNVLMCLRSSRVAKP
jgi:hypothetical protein